MMVGSCFEDALANSVLTVHKTDQRWDYNCKKIVHSFTSQLSVVTIIHLFIFKNIYMIYQGKNRIEARYVFTHVCLLFSRIIQSIVEEAFLALRERAFFNVLVRLSGGSQCRSWVWRPTAWQPRSFLFGGSHGETCWLPTARRSWDGSNADDELLNRRTGSITNLFNSYALLLSVFQI